MAESLILKQGGGVGSDELTATVAQVLSGYTAVTKDSDDEIGTGTMPNRGAVSQTLNAGDSYTVPQGYHNGNGKVTANSLASQTPANAVASNLTKGKTAWVNGVRVVGNGSDNTTFYNNGYSTGYENGTKDPTFTKIENMVGAYNSSAHQNTYNTGIKKKVLWKTIFIVPMNIPASGSSNNNFYNGGGITYNPDTGAIVINASYRQVTADIYYIE